jgi:hypothetical protein
MRRPAGAPAASLRSLPEREEKEKKKQKKRENGKDHLVSRQEGADGQCDQNLR